MVSLSSRYFYVRFQSKLTAGLDDQMLALFLMMHVHMKFRSTRMSMPSLDYTYRLAAAHIIATDSIWRKAASNQELSGQLMYPGLNLHPQIFNGVTMSGLNIRTSFCCVVCIIFLVCRPLKDTSDAGKHSLEGAWPASSHRKHDPALREAEGRLVDKCGPLQQGAHQEGCHS